MPNSTATSASCTATTAPRRRNGAGTRSRSVMPLAYAPRQAIQAPLPQLLRGSPLDEPVVLGSGEEPLQRRPARIGEPHFAAEPREELAQLRGVACLVEDV